MQSLDHGGKAVYLNPLTTILAGQWQKGGGAIVFW
jgi:hypothetical protein